MARNALGRGLSALIREPEQKIEEGRNAVVTAPPGTAHVGPSPSNLVDIDLIEPSPYQPRTRFREETLEELARSLRTSGMIQPLVVRRMGARYQLIAGERRWRAAQRAGIQRVPVVLREARDEEALELSLVENLQREDLNPIEEARGFKRLLDEFGLTQEVVAERTGKDRSTVANAIRLLKLEAPIQQMIEEGRLSAGHGRALLAIEEPRVRREVAQAAARGGVTVRQVERLAARRSRPQSPVVEAPSLDANTRAAVEELQRVLGTKVVLRPRTKRKAGQLVIEYYDERQLMGLYDRLTGGKS